MATTTAIITILLVGIAVCPTLADFDDAFFSQFNFPEMKTFGSFFGNIPVFAPIKQIDPEEIKSFKPKDGTTYTGSAVSFSSHSSDVNGKKKSGASFKSITNNNGNVKEEGFSTDDGDDNE